jgi:hypothetical protein
MTLHFHLLFLLLLSPLLSSGQDLITDERVVDPTIKTVQINPGSPYPVVELRNGKINLQFDCIGTDLRDFLYTIIHCDSDWTPSQLQDNEYIDGFMEDRITNISTSVNTLTDYTHYQLTLPNQNMRFTKSGNYLLIIMDDDNDKETVMVRRFMVSENTWKTTAQLSPVVSSRKIFTHHEIDFQVSHDGFLLSNPTNEVQAYVYQNMRWDRVFGPIAPRPFVSVKNKLSFDYQDSIVFPAGKEWRFFDMRTYNFRGPGIQKIERNNQTWQVYLKPEQDRSESIGYELVNDLNGNYTIENRTAGESFLQTDYANVLFILEQDQPFDNEDVYVFGALTDWQLKPEFKMQYDDDSKSYYCNPLLKQGYYNYSFLVVNADTFQASEDNDQEGNWHETDNVYNVFTYYRPFGGNYDRLVSVGGVDSRSKRN